MGLSRSAQVHTAAAKSTAQGSIFFVLQQQQEAWETTHSVCWWKRTIGCHALMN
jgi:hypothetical protein